MLSANVLAQERIDNCPKYPPDRELRHVNQFIWIDDCWTVSDDGLHAQSDLHNLSDLYSKWLVRLDLKESSPGFYRNYIDEQRSRLRRLFSGKSRSTIVALKLTTANPTIDLTVPLMTLSYEGKVGNGESFISSLTQSNEDQPYFRLTAATATNATISAKVTSDVESRFAVSVLGFVQNALKIAAPQSTLLTAINKDESSKAVTALDSTLGRLASQSTSENTTVGRLVEHWNDGSKLRVRIHVPTTMAPTASGFPEHSGRGANEALNNWLVFRLELSCPRYSMFSDRDICDASKTVVTDGSIDSGRDKTVNSLRRWLSAQQVLDFPLASGVTIRQHLAGKDWFSRYLRLAPAADTQKAPADGPAALKPAKAQEPTPIEQTAFCESVVNELHSVGLSTLDAKLGLWAIALGSGDLGDSRRLLDGNAVCVALLPSPMWSFVPEIHRQHHLDTKPWRANPSTGDEKAAKEIDVSATEDSAKL